LKPRHERKVYYLHPDSESPGCPFRVIPMIRLTGKFLEGFGFYVGEAIHVEYEPGKITITKKEDDNGCQNE